MADNIITPEFRAGFISVFRATKQRDAAADAKAKYSVRACFPPSSDMTELKAQAGQAAKAKWNDKVPKNLNSPFRLNGDLDNPVPGLGEDWIIMTFSANEDRKPGLVGPDLNTIKDEDQVYSGAWFRAQVRAFAYENAGNKGVSFGLQNLQKLKDGEPIGAGRVPAEKAFSAFAAPASSAADEDGSDIFG